MDVITWAFKSYDNSEILGLLFGKDKYELYSMAYNTFSSKTVVSRMNNVGTIFWSHEINMAYKEAPMLSNYE